MLRTVSESFSKQITEIRLFTSMDFFAAIGIVTAKSAWGLAGHWTGFRQHGFALSKP